MGHFPSLSSDVPWGRGRHKGNINHFDFITSPHPRELVVSGLTSATSSANQNILWAHIQQFGALGMENWGKPEVTQVYFGKSKDNPGGTGV